jgi:branched-chain amino acid transport system substrate-binding protein
MDPKVRSLVNEYQAGRISRRDFMRVAGGLIGGVAAASVLAACGTTPAPATQAPQAQATQAQPTSPPASAQVIRIGSPHPLTGPWAENGTNGAWGVEMAVDDINAQGGIKSMGGAMLELVKGDTQNDPALAASATRRLIENDKVVALIGCYLSSLTLTASTEAEKAGIPMLSESFLDDLTARGYKYFFQPPAKASMMGSSAASYFKEASQAAGLNLVKVANISDDNANTQKQAQTITEQATSLGYDQLFLEYWTAGLTDASAIVNKVRTSDADLCFINGPTPDVILIVRTLRSLGWNKPIVGTGGGGILNKGFGEALGNACDGVFGIAAWSWDMPYPGLSDIATAFEQRYDEPFLQQETGECYVMTWMVKEALEAVGEANPTKIRDYLASAVFKTAPACLMPGNVVEFDDTGWNINSFPVMIEWKDVKPHAVWPEEVRAMDPFFG